MLFKTFLSGLAFGAALFLSLAPAEAETPPHIRWEALGPSERAFVDRIAADFYEQSLRLAQSSAIESRTSELYSGASPADRARFRAERREAWQGMNGAQRDALRNVKRPSFRNLTEAQKWPFRAHALVQLGAAGAIDDDAVAARLGRDI